MSEEKTKLSLEELTQPCEPSDDAAYVAWSKDKIRAALKEAQDQPDQVISQAELRKRLGLER